jgi:MFS transporter, DHA1 family, multidrug resistance protein
VAGATPPPSEIATPITRRKLFLLGAIAALGSLATQLLVPALPSIAGELQIGVGPAQLVVGVFLVGLGAGQLLVGPLADRMERRTLLLLGLLVYTIASIAAGLAGSLAVLLAARLAQAIGSSAGLVSTRVLLNSLVPPDKAVAAQASLMAIVLVSPALAPVIGGVMTEWLGWRMIMLTLGAAGLAALLVVLHTFPKNTERNLSVRDRGFLEDYRVLMRNRRFLAATVILACGTAALYLFLGSAPFLFENQYHLSPRETGLCLVLIAVASIGGTRMVALAQRLGDPLRLSTAMTLVAVLSLGALSWSGNPALPLLLGPMTFVGLAAGLTGPCAIGHVLACEPGLEGTATSLAGALQMTTSALMAWLLGKFAATNVAHLALAMLPLTTIALGSALWLVRATAPR